MYARTAKTERTNHSKSIQRQFFNLNRTNIHVESDKSIVIEKLILLSTILILILI
jgi:hypothetical protein